MKKFLLLCLLLPLAWCNAAHAQRILIGKRAPELRIATWLADSKPASAPLTYIEFYHSSNPSGLAVYDRPEDIDWDALPERFAIKWNFGCGYNLICTDKSALDTNAAEKQLRAWGREPFWAYYSELQYRHVEKKLLVEEYIGSADGTLPEDYKFYCFHGRADCVMLCVGRDEGWPKFYFFDRDFRLLRINRDSQAAPEDFTLPKPAGLDEAFAIADRLSKPFDFVRVDLYLTPRGVRFGELTFTPAAALDNKRLPETDLRFGRRMEETL